MSTIEMMDIIVARVAKRQQRRFWTTEQKRRIVAEARAYGASVAAVARRPHLNANLLHTWMRDPQFAEAASGPTLLPVEIVEDAGDQEPATEGPRSPIEIEAPCGLRIRCDDTVDEGVLVRVLSAIRRAT
ncbi:MAG: transposase [Pseudomonadota bacterium]